MQQVTSKPSTPTGPIFDVYVRNPDENDIEEAERLAHETSGISPERVAVLFKALRNGSPVKLGAGVSLERAEKAKAQLSKAGLVVTMTPVLSLTEMEAPGEDGRYYCLNCENRVQLTEKRQCTKCGVFVDKISAESMLKKKIKQDERSKLEMEAEKEVRASEKRNKKLMEDAIREQVRAELEAEFGVKNTSDAIDSRLKLIKIAGIFMLLPFGFYGGYLFSNYSVSTQPAAMSKGVEKPSVNAGVVVDVKSTDAAGDVEDRIFEKPGGGSISLDQALAASSKLAQSVGNTTAQRAWGSGDAKDQNAAVNSNNASGGSGMGATRTDMAPSIGESVKARLMAEFAVQLAEMGQFQRADQALQTLNKLSAVSQISDFSLSSPMVALEVEAWKLNQFNSLAGQMAASMDALRTQALSVSANPIQKVRALSRLGVVAGQQNGVPISVSKDFLGAASSLVKTLPPGDDASLGLDVWRIGMMQTHTAEVESLVQGGQWSKAKSIQEKSDEILRGVQNKVTLIQLSALSYKTKKILGQNENAAASFRVAVDGILGLADPILQLDLMRKFIQFSGEKNPDVFSDIVGALEVKSIPLNGVSALQYQSGLALIYLDLGFHQKFKQTVDRMKTVKTNEVKDVDAAVDELLIQSELADAKHLHKAGRYPEAELVLRRVAGKLSS